MTDMVVMYQMRVVHKWGSSETGLQRRSLLSRCLLEVCLPGRRSQSCLPGDRYVLGRILRRGSVARSGDCLAGPAGCVPRAPGCQGSAGTPERGSGQGTAGGTTACPSGDGPGTRWCPRRDVDLPTSSPWVEGGSRWAAVSSLLSL